MLAYIDWFTSSDIFTFPESLPLIGGLPVRWYGVMFATAFLLGYQVISYFFKKEGRPLEQADELLLCNDRHCAWRSNGTLFLL
jgi:hypothetical protein